MAEVDDFKDVKRHWVATARNWGAIEVEIFDDALEYGRALKAAQRDHARGEWDTYTHGDNRVMGKASHGRHYIATMGNLGLEVGFYDSLEEYMADLNEQVQELSAQRLDNLCYSGPEPTIDPDRPDEDDEDDEDDLTAASPAP